MRENRPRESELDDMLYSFRTDQTVTVQTPPRTLTVSQHSFPSSSGKDFTALPDNTNIMAFSEKPGMEQTLALQADMNMSTFGQSPNKK